jgi:acetyl esterase
MTTPLDPVIAEIIPRLPLRDPDTMTPQSARDALRALAAARAAVPPPPVESAKDIQGERRDRTAGRARLSRLA